MCFENYMLFKGIFWPETHIFLSLKSTFEVNFNGLFERYSIKSGIFPYVI